MPECLECKQETNNPKFCNRICAAKFNNRNRIDKCPNKLKTKSLLCSCGAIFAANIRSEPKRTKCPECKRRKCHCCGEEKCPRPEICKRKQLLLGTLKDYFGFNIDTIGSLQVIKEFDRIKCKIHDYYSTNSLKQICDLIDYHSGPSNLWNILRIFNIEYRSISEANRKLILDGYSPAIRKNYPYKFGWHTTWEGKNIFYRSSYELEYAKQLDEQKIKYELETLRIEYWDSCKCKHRIAIPDFYLPETNEIVEIKSSWTLNEQNMKDRFKKFKDLGYTYKMILNKQVMPL